MIFDTFSIARKRYRMRKTLRFAALVLAMIALMTEAYDALFAVWGSRSFWEAILSNGAWVMGATFVVGAAVLIISERWLVKWLVPWPRGGCHVCGYDTTGVRDGVCPECTAPTSQAGPIKPAS